MEALLKAITNRRIIELPKASKEESLFFLSKSLSDYIKAKDGGQIYEKVLYRENEGNTYLGYGVACPHARIKEEGDLECAIGWSHDGIAYSKQESSIARIVILYYVPDNKSNEYLHEISCLARILDRNKEVYYFNNLIDSEDTRTRLLEWIDSKPGNSVIEIRQIFDPKSDYMQFTQFLLPEILELLHNNRLNTLRAYLMEQTAPDIAELIRAIPDKSHILIFRLLPRKLADEVFSSLDHFTQNLLLENMAQEETRKVISALSPDDRTALFEELPARVTQKLLDLLNSQERQQALTLLSYPENSVGRLMTNRYVTARSEWTVAQTMEHIRKVGIDSETMVVIYIVDDNGVLKDDVLIRKIILASPETYMSELLDGYFVNLYSLQDREDAVRVFKKYNVYALPVVDSDGVLLGIVTTDDILDVAEEEATEDFHKGSAISPLSISYLQAPISMLYRRRISWLIILVVINIFSGAGIAYFEKLIESAVALVFFLPLLIGSGGNAGSQSATLVIRSMALGEISPLNYFRTLWRESLVSLILGLSMAIAVFVLAYFRANVYIAIVAGVSMIVIVVLSSVIGMSLPFVLKKLGQDPAVASSPLVTSIADIFGVIIYLGIASFLLSKGN